MKFYGYGANLNDGGFGFAWPFIAMSDQSRNRYGADKTVVYTQEFVNGVDTPYSIEVIDYGLQNEIAISEDVNPSVTFNLDEDEYYDDEDEATDQSDKAEAWLNSDPDVYVDPPPVSGDDIEIPGLSPENRYVRAHPGNLIPFEFTIAGKNIEKLICNPDGSVTKGEIFENIYFVVDEPSGWNTNIIRDGHDGSTVQPIYYGSPADYTLIVNIPVTATPSDYTITLKMYDGQGQYFSKLEFIVEVVVEDIANTGDLISYKDMSFGTSGQIVADGGIIDLDSVEIGMFGTSISSIGVSNGGSFTISDSIIWTADASGTEIPFSISVDGGTLKIKNSILMGVDQINVISGNVIITGSTIFGTSTPTKNSLINLASGGETIICDSNLFMNNPWSAINIESGNHPTIESNWIQSITAMATGIGVNIPTGHTGDIVVSGNQITGFGTGISVNRDIEHTDDTQEISNNFIYGNGIGIYGSPTNGLELIGNVITENTIVGLKIGENMQNVNVNIIGGCIENNGNDLCIGENGINYINVDCYDVVSETLFTLTQDSSIFTLEIFYSVSLHVVDDTEFHNPIENANVRMSEDSVNYYEGDTDSNGDIIFEDVLRLRIENGAVENRDSYSLAATKVGYNPYSEDNINLLEPLLKEVILTGNGAPA